MPRHLQHYKVGSCGRCGTLCEMRPRRAVWHYGKVCNGCYKLCTPDTEALAGAIAGLLLGTHSLKLGFNPGRGRV